MEALIFQIIAKGKDHVEIVNKTLGEIVWEGRRDDHKGIAAALQKHKAMLSTLPNLPDRETPDYRSIA